MPIELARWHKVKFSNAALNEVADAIQGWVDSQSDYTKLPVVSPATLPFHSFSVNTEANRVIVWSEKATELPFLADFADRVIYATQEPPKPITCNDYFHCTPWRGGISAEVYSDGNLAYHGTLTMNVHYAGNVNLCYMESAGHTGFNPGNQWNRSIYHNTDYLGYTIGGQSTLYSDATPRTDARRIPRACNDGNGGAMSNSLYKRTGFTNSGMSSIEPWSSQLNGDPVCKSGTGGGWGCGTISDDNYYFTDSTPSGTRSVGAGIQISVSFGDVVGGDSGAAYWARGTGRIYGLLAIGAPLGDWGGGSAADNISSENYIIWCLNTNCTNTTN